MNGWTSSPSPSLDALSSQAPLSSSSVFLVGWHIALTQPRRLWDAYVAHLWYYQPNSLVGRLASTFRILAVVLVLPVVLLTLLDVTSYVIARTLGIVDDVKASTSDADTSCSSDARDQIGAGVGGEVSVPTMTTYTCPLSSNASTSATASSTSPWSYGVSVGVGVGSVRASGGFVPEEDPVEREMERDGNGDGDAHGHVSETTRTHTRTTIQYHSQSRTRSDQDTLSASPQAYYFAAEAELRLAGEGVFSPAVSMPPSPITPRMPLDTFAESGGQEVGQVREVVLKRRVQIAREDELSHT